MKKKLTLIIILLVSFNVNSQGYFKKNNKDYPYYTYWRCDDLLTSKKDKDAIQFAVFKYLINKDEYKDYIPTRLDVETISFLKPKEHHGLKKDDVYVIMDIKNIYNDKRLQIHLRVRWSVIEVFEMNNGGGFIKK